MIPIFKTTYSIGKSLLTLNAPSKDTDDGSDSVFSLLAETKEKDLWLVEDSMIGFFKAFKRCKELGYNLRFGYRFSCCEDLEKKDSYHKLVLFALNDQGCKDLNMFYSLINSSSSNGVAVFNDLKKSITKNLLLVVPFYDSFIFNNSLFSANCIVNFNGLSPTFFIEDNNLPFDSLIQSLVKEFADKNQYPIVKVKSIFYKNKDDSEALQTYKLICNRSFGKKESLSRPNLQHFGSDEFSWESYKEQAQ